MVRPSSLGTLVGAIAAALLVPSIAAAGPLRLNLDPVEGLYCFPLPSCAEAAECVEEDVGTACELYWLDEEPTRYCAASPAFRTEVLCCESAEECGARDGTAGACSTLLGLTLGVCTYPGVFDFCASDDGVLENRLAPCLRPPVGSEGGVGRWVDGDCDEDGVRNKDDCCPCDPDPACLCPDDPDPHTDAGSGSDGGSSTSDAATIDPRDADVGDADTGADDSGTSALDPGPGLRGAGGCECRMAHGNESGSFLALACIAVLAWRARRRPTR